MAFFIFFSMLLDDWRIVAWRVCDLPPIFYPGKVLSLNDLLQVHIPPTTFTTCFYAVLEPTDCRLCFINAGHNLPYLSQAGDVIELRATGMPLGLMPEQEYPEQEVAIAENVRVLFYTYGLVEAHDPDDEMFGIPRLKRLMQGYPYPDGLIQFFLDQLQEFTREDWEQEDDVTLVLLRRTV